MNITFDKRIKDNKFKEDFTVIAGIYARHLDIPDTLNLKVVVRTMPGVYGQVQQFEEYFLLELGRNFLKDGQDINMTRIVAHELTHVAQFVRGDLKDDVKREITYYKGIAYDLNHKLSRRKCFYILPFEREAILNERILYSKLKKEFKPIRLKIS